MGVKVQIIFKQAVLAGIIESATKLGKELPADFTGPTFEDADFGPATIPNFVAVRPLDVDTEDGTTYLYPSDMIGRIKVQRVAERTTDSGIVVVNKPGIELVR